MTPFGTPETGSRNVKVSHRPPG
uniref:Uncharacterized protein n=1 Tax=Anguilla anguilla TaxID=7936 RepID=A0A0E9V793_ANGAN